MIHWSFLPWNHRNFSACGRTDILSSWAPSMRGIHDRFAFGPSCRSTVAGQSLLPMHYYLAPDPTSHGLANASNEMESTARRPKKRGLRCSHACKFPPKTPPAVTMLNHSLNRFTCHANTLRPLTARAALQLLIHSSSHAALLPAAIGMFSTRLCHMDRIHKRSCTCSVNC